MEFLECSWKIPRGARVCVAIGLQHLLDRTVPFFSMLGSGTPCSNEGRRSQSGIYLYIYMCVCVFVESCGHGIVDATLYRCCSPLQVLLMQVLCDTWRHYMLLGRYSYN